MRVCFVQGSPSGARSILEKVRFAKLCLWRDFFALNSWSITFSVSDEDAFSGKRISSNSYKILNIYSTFYTLSNKKIGIHSLIRRITIMVIRV